MFGSASWARSPPNASQQDPKAIQQHPEIERGTEHSPFIIQIQQTPQIQQSPETNHDRKPEKWFSSWSLSDKIAAIASLAAFLQFIALVATVWITIQNGRRQLRAYVLPASAGLWEGMMLTPPRPEHANEPGVVLLFKNSGQTPAHRYVSWAQIAVTELANSHTLLTPSLQLQFPATIGAGCMIN
jgi:hypothetical protein